MFDSIRFYLCQEFPITPESFGWGYTFHITPFGDTSECLEYRGNGSPTYTNIKYFPVSQYNSRSTLVVTIGSVQKVTIGNNFQTCVDINLIIRKLNEYLRTIPGLSSIDSSDGIMTMVDFCHNYHLGQMLPYYMEVLLNKRNPHRHFKSFENADYFPHKANQGKVNGGINGISLESSTVTTSYYLKEDECGDTRAAGILRQEERLEGKKTIEQHTGLTNPRLKDMTPEISAMVLARDLHHIGMDQDILTKISTRERLVETHGKQRGHELYLLLLSLEGSHSYKAKDIKLHTGYSSSKISRIKKKLKDAGVPWDLSPLSITLPKLEVKFRDDDSKNDIKVTSDTGEVVTPLTEQEIEDLSNKLEAMTGQSQTSDPEAVGLMAEKDRNQASVTSHQGIKLPMIQIYDESSVFTIDVLVLVLFGLSISRGPPSVFLEIMIDHKYSLHGNFRNRALYSRVD